MNHPGPAGYSALPGAEPGRFLTPDSDPMIDPLTTDTWNMPLMDVVYHLYPAGSPVALCGQTWQTFYDGSDKPPADPKKRCPECEEVRKCESK